MEAGRDAIAEVVRFARVGVCQVADVAVEGAVAEEGLGPVEFGCVVGCTAAHDWGISGFDGGVYGVGLSVWGKDLGDEGVEVVVCLDVGGDEDERFVGDV